MPEGYRFKTIFAIHFHSLPAATGGTPSTFFRHEVWRVRVEPFPVISVESEHGICTPFLCA